MAEHAPPTERALLPDLIRAFALIGIITVNVAIFAHPFELGYREVGRSHPLDLPAEIAIYGLFAFKSYALFSFMFGASFAYQLAGAARAGASASGRHARRVIGLLTLGILHAAFLFAGDILFIYGLLGAVLFAMKDWSPKRLVIVGAVLMIVQVLVILAFAGLFHMAETYAPEDAPNAGRTQDAVAAATAAFGEGGFADASLYRLQYFPSVVFGGLMFQGVGALSYFLLGLAAVKTGAIQDPTRPVWRWARRALLIGAPVSLFLGWRASGAESPLSAEMLLYTALLGAAAPLSAFGYAGWIAKACEGTPGPVRRFLARAGSASLTAYLLQSLILSLVFANYGLGLYRELGAAACLGVALSAGAASLVFAGLWRGAFRRGPMEALLRRFTYGAS